MTISSMQVWLKKGTDDVIMVEYGKEDQKRCTRCQQNENRCFLRRVIGTTPTCTIFIEMQADHGGMKMTSGEILPTIVYYIAHRRPNTGQWLSGREMAEFGGKGSTWNHVLPGTNGSCQNGNGRETCAIGHGRRKHRPNGHSV